MSLIKFTFYDVPDQFSEVINSHFSEPRGANELMLGITETLVNDPEHYGAKPFLATVEDKGEFKLAAMRTHPWSILLYARENTDDEIYTYLIDFLINNKEDIPGVNARTDISERFAKLWCHRRKLQKLLKMEMRVYVLDEVNDVPLSRGELIRADEKYRELIQNWAAKFNDEAGLEMKPELLECHIDFAIGSGFTHIWVDKRPVSMVFGDRPSRKGISTNFVYTPPEYRNLGYATSSVATLCRRLLTQGYEYTFLFADLANPVSNSIYKKIGYKPVCDYSNYTFGGQVEQ